MGRRLRRVSRVAAVLLPFALAACQTFIKPSAPCDGDGCPRTICDPKVLTKPTMHAAASDLDHLERHIDWHGSVTAKVPDVWGQARLTLYREQFEAEMVKELPNFKESLQGSTARSDQAFALSSTALSAALGGKVATNTLPAGAYGAINNNGIPDKQGELKQPIQQIVTTVPAVVGVPGLVTNVGANTAPTAANYDFFTTGGTNFRPTDFKAGFTASDKLQLSLEPSEFLEQKKRYLDLLAQIRRTNEGDDTADAPGYAMNLMRIPVSVLPGKRTDSGHGAEITMTLAPILGDDLLPVTFRKLVINDLVYQLGLPITRTLSERDEQFVKLITPELRLFVETVVQINDYLDWEGGNSPSARRIVKKLYEDGTADVVIALFSSGNDDLDIFQDLKGNVTIGQTRRLTGVANFKTEKISVGPFNSFVAAPAPDAGSVIPAAATGAAIPAPRKALPAPAPKRPPQLGTRLSAALTIPVPSFAPNTDNRTGLPTSQLVDVYGTAYSFEIAYGARQAFAKTVERQNYAHLPDVQAYLKEELNAAYDMLAEPKNHELWDFCRPELVHLIRTQSLDKLDEKRREFRYKLVQLAQSSPNNKNRPEPMQLSKTAAFAWAILVDAALLTDKLCKDMKSSASARNTAIPGVADWLALYLPTPPLEVCHTFNQYVRVRWPIHVFALDPTVQEQNLADRLSTRREIQLALSMAFVSGNMNFNQLNRFARRLEAEYETIDLNRTQIGFGHGPDTFGWRFYPRYQTPDTPGNLQLLGRDLIAGGPNKNQLLRERRLEPGPRECVALVIMPSFVPAVQIDTTSNFFGLANPKHKVFDHSQAVKLGRTVQAIKTAGLTDANCYRDGDAARLVKRAEQLEARLPMQTTTFPVPTEDSTGGFELFGTSTTNLAPELYGWYGAPGVGSTKPTTLFLVGNHFSPLRTRVIAGNKEVSKENPAKVTMLSRQVIQVEFGPDLIPLNAAHVTIHVATPYGVSRELLVPLVNSATSPDGYYLANESKLGITYATTAAAGPPPDQFTAAFAGITADPVIISGQFANGVVPTKVKVEIVGVTGLAELTAKTPGKYAVEGAEFQKLVEAWFGQFVLAKQAFTSTAEVERRVPPSMILRVTPMVDGQSGTAREVYGVLRVTATKQTAPVARPPAVELKYTADGATLSVECQLEAVGEKFRVKSVTVPAAAITIKPAPADTAPKKVKVGIAGGPTISVEVALVDGAYKLEAMTARDLAAAWAKQVIGDTPITATTGDAAADAVVKLIPKTLKLQIAAADGSGGNAKDVTGDVTVTATAKKP